MMSGRTWRPALETLTLAAAVFLVASFSLAFAREAGRIAVVWPANALLLAVLLKTRDPRSAVFRGAAAFFGYLAANLMAGDSPVIAIGLSGANVVEAGLCAFAVTRLVRGAFDLTRSWHLFTFGAVAALLAPLFAGVIASTALFFHNGASLWSTLSVWWPADALGLLIFTPALLTLADPSAKTLLSRGMRLRTLRVSAILAATLAVVFVQSRYPLLYLVPPILVLTAFELGMAGAALGLLATAVFAIVLSVNGHGPAMLVEGGLGAKAITLQVYLGFLVFATLPLASVLATQRRLRGLVAEQGRSLRLLVDGVSDYALFMLDPTGGVVNWNAGAARLTGYSANDAMGRHFASFYGGEAEGGGVPETAVEIALRAGAYEGEVWGVRKGGERYRAHVIIRPIHEDDQLLGFANVTRDVTQRFEAEAEAQASANRLAEAHALAQLAEKTAGVGYWTHRAATGETEWSSEMYRIFGFEPSDGVRPLDEVIARYHPDDREEARARTLASLESGEDQQAVLRLLSDDGAWRWVVASTTCQLAFDGSIRAVIGTFVDITRLREAEAAAAQSEERYRQLADSIPDLIIRINRDGVITYASLACRTYGYEPEDLIGRRVIDFVHPEDAAGADERTKLNLADAPLDASMRREQRVRTASGDWVWLEGNPSQLRNAAGDVIETVNAFRNVTVRRALEDDLTEARRVAERANEAKTEFLSNMSHELRTPLTSIIGFSGLLKASGALPEREALFAQRIDSASHTLLDLVNNLLDFSKIEAGEVILEQEEVDVGELVVESLALVAEQAAKANLELGAGYPKALRLENADRIRLRQVLVNLLANAVKFTDAGSVRLDVARVEDGSMRFAVTDTGCGIPADRLQHVFDRFTQADGSTTRTHGGTGLGLAICRGLVEAMGGEIGVESEVGAGSTFWFTVPPTTDARGIHAA